MEQQQQQNNNNPPRQENMVLHPPHRPWDESTATAKLFECSRIKALAGKSEAVSMQALALAHEQPTPNWRHAHGAEVCLAVVSVGAGRSSAQCMLEGQGQIPDCCGPSLAVQCSAAAEGRSISRRRQTRRFAGVGLVQSLPPCTLSSRPCPRSRVASAILVLSACSRPAWSASGDSGRRVGCCQGVREGSPPAVHVGCEGGGQVQGQEGLRAQAGAGSGTAGFLVVLQEGGGWAWRGCVSPSPPTSLNSAR